MFRSMRRPAQQLTDAQARDILLRGTSGVLALSGDGGYPYAVPRSYAVMDDHIYFHSAPEGHKVDAVLRENKCSFCVVGQDVIMPLEYTTYYQSVIAFGRVGVVEAGEEWVRAMRAIADKYAPSHPTGPEHAIQSSRGHMHILRMDVEHLTGKQALKLTNREAK